MYLVIMEDNFCFMNINAIPVRFYKRDGPIDQNESSSAWVATDASNLRYRVSTAKVSRNYDTLHRGSLRSLMKEAEILKTLTHPNVLQLIDDFEFSGQFYLVREDFAKTLAEVVSSRKLMTDLEVRFLLRQLLSFLDQLHQKEKLIHGNLRLENLTVNKTMQLKIVGFGTAVPTDGVLKSDDLSGLLQAGFIAPEVLGGCRPTAKADVWAVGCIMNQLLGGVNPFSTHDQSTLKGIFERMKQGKYAIPKTTLSKGAASILRRLLQYDPAARPDAKEILTDHFFVNGPLAETLPMSCLSVKPNLDPAMVAKDRKAMGSPRQVNVIGSMSPQSTCTKKQPTCKEHKLDLCKTIQELLLQPLSQPDLVKSTAPAEGDLIAVPSDWVSHILFRKDNSREKLGYMMSDGRICVYYRDGTSVVTLAESVSSFRHFNTKLEARICNTNTTEEDIMLKAKDLQKFTIQMLEEEMDPENFSTGKENIDIKDIRILHWTPRWAAASNHHIFLLSNGSLQVLYPKFKLLVDPKENAITFMANGDNPKQVKSFRFSTISASGCTANLQLDLQLCLEAVNAVISELS